MNLNGIRYGKKFNIGNYESEEISVDAAVQAGESPSECLKSMMDFVNSKGGIPWPGMSVMPPKTTKEEKVEMSAAKKVEKAEPKMPEQLPLVAAPEEAAPTPAPKAAKKEKTIGRPPKEFAETPEEKATVKTVGKSPKSSTYNRSIDLHKKLVSELLDANFPNWRGNPSKAKSVSEKLEGTEFLDGEGIILPAFKTVFLEAMK